MDNENQLLESLLEIKTKKREAKEVSKRIKEEMASDPRFAEAKAAMDLAKDAFKTERERIEARLSDDLLQLEAIKDDIKSSQVGLVGVALKMVADGIEPKCVDPDTGDTLSVEFKCRPVKAE
jgi:hypothetical protein